MRVVIALGGNALAAPGAPANAESQRANIATAAAAIADIARAHEVVITHGNGPQIGWLAAQQSVGRNDAGLPLDVLGAESEGVIGYWLERELAQIFPGSEIATLLTQVEVSRDDPAFEAATKPIGPLVDEAQAASLRERLGHCFVARHGGYRRVVPSPRPLRVREARTIERLMGAGVLVICAGGGGIPVTLTSDGGIYGVEAVIDKDLTSALLAQSVGADRLLLLTDVEGVYTDWPNCAAAPLDRTDPQTLAKFDFEVGSMAPKVEAAVEFVRATGKTASIGALEQAVGVFEGRAGTHVAPAAATGTA
ncbi:MAG: carbamate kinase [bacterium]|nr:carbamate kinase [bacterium]